MKKYGKNLYLVSRESYLVKEQMIRKIKNFRDLDIWKKSIEVVKDIYKTVSGFPKLELYSLTNQIQRASLSIPTNIAEGFKSILFF